ncbi:tumor necrosis factor receptor superfamily member 1A-like [Varanus komodoensis]|uniref:Tumor necrosis factor receptor superfamily member 1A n=1 Tax=Varanus komodoensis TaxID=61221 RepID=A0A8D2KRN2_VARKO|nr:tumor necrosis factor receptor superfamily member 1A-like [Varanus komodoensis]
MVPLGLFPVLLALIKLILIQMATGESLELAFSRNTMHAIIADKKNINHSNGREKRELSCGKGYFPHPNRTHCCFKCHRGMYVERDCVESNSTPICRICHPGTYMPEDNYSDRCFECQHCHTNLGQKVLSSCTPEKDTVCGCAENQYRTSHTSEFFCKDCSACHNGTIRKTCTEFSDTVCECHYGFFLQTDQSNCSPCSSCNAQDCEARCKALNVVTHQPSSLGLMSVLSSLVVFFGAGCMLLLIRRIVKPSCQRTLSSPWCPYPSIQQPAKELPAKSVANDFLLEQNQEIRMSPKQVIQVPGETSQPVQGLPDCVKSAGKTQLPDCPTVLYIVADHVPVSRWKEFVRRLGLNENTIERISMEQRHIREAQYEMLGQWRLQAAHGATVEHISNVLNEMELSGCSEAIQEVLTSLS